ncbi:hypothetical protein CJF30_00003167 [Rutstroemia sp. NJR-2017a BBW]|nr:hypothetical protein CJF30_00003167 [Rutstroemia sp. NJR-2017a BBW]
MQISPPRNAAMNSLKRVSRSNPYPSLRPKQPASSRSHLAPMSRNVARESHREMQRESEVSIIVTTWDDEGKCWYPVEAFGPIGRELNAFIERRRRELSGGLRTVHE